LSLQWLMMRHKTIFATPCAPCLKKPSQRLPHCCMPSACHCSHCTIIFITNNNFIVRPHHHHSHLKYIIIMPYVKKAGQGALGEDLAINSLSAMDGCDRPLNSLTAMGIHGHPHFNELRSTVVSCRIFIRSQSLIAR
jgi:hypothetical protein